jgi:diketogulonate reductase-like aldo/keto reductase
LIPPKFTAAVKGEYTLSWENFEENFVIFSERCIARYRAESSVADAKDIVILTKFLPLPYKFSYPSSLINALRASLDRLKVSCVDLYQIHGPIHFRSIEVVADALAEAVKQGLTKTVGVSNYSTADTIKMYDCLQKHGIQLASNQVEYSLLRRTPETSGLIAECHKRGIAILGYSPLVSEEPCVHRIQVHVLN